ncbi:DNA-3-methyladenine glycosylase family protein [Streptomyces sp. NPDC052043]|uniref:DNA-3-methyladenine glycosylase family protein n=1 Tax=Streptomyces sp. NPDC052043 TaxID=3365684 RepID=UPI0037D88F67
MSIIRIDARGPFHHTAALALLAAHAIPGTEEVDGTRYRRVLAVEDEHTVVTLDLNRHGMTASFEPPISDRETAAAMVRAWFDLDTDTAAIDRALAQDPRRAGLVRRRPALRLIRYPDEFEAVAATVIGQQVSLAAARTFAGRLVTACGHKIDDLHAFPDATTLAQRDADEIQKHAGLTRARTRTLHEVAVRWADGPVLQGLPADEARQVLLTIPGIGPWTADYLLVRALQHPDTFVPGDLVARRALGLEQKAAAERSAAWDPYRSYALLHLGTDAAYL